MLRCAENGEFVSSYRAQDGKGDDEGINQDRSRAAFYLTSI